MNDFRFDYLQKMNRWYWGTLLGLIFPLFWYFFWWLFFVEPSLAPDEKSIRYGFFLELNMNVLRLCVLGNLLIFYFFLNRNLQEWVKGIIIASFLYIILFVVWLYIF